MISLITHMELEPTVTYDLTRARNRFQEVVFEISERASRISQVVDDLHTIVLGLEIALELFKAFGRKLHDIC